MLCFKAFDGFRLWYLFSLGIKPLPPCAGELCQTQVPNGVVNQEQTSNDSDADLESREGAVLVSNHHCLNSMLCARADGLE